MYSLIDVDSEPALDFTPTAGHLDGLTDPEQLVLSLYSGLEDGVCYMVGEIVSVGDARVTPGDIVRGDSDGVVVIPRVHEEDVLAAAEEIHAAEMRIRDAIAGGMRLDEARKQQSYHLLQRKVGA